MAKQTAGPARKKACSTCRDKKIKCEQDAGSSYCKFCKERGFACSGPQHTPRWQEKEQKKMLNKRTAQGTNEQGPTVRDQTIPTCAPILSSVKGPMMGTAWSTDFPVSVQAPLAHGNGQSGAPNTPARQSRVAGAPGDHVRRAEDPLVMPSWQYTPYIQPAVANQNAFYDIPSYWSHETIKPAYANQNANFPYRSEGIPACDFISNTSCDPLSAEEYEELLRTFKNL